MRRYALFLLGLAASLSLWTGCSSGSNEAPVEPAPQNRSFTLTLEKATATTIVIDVAPVDKHQPYVLLLGNRDYLEENNLIGDDAALIADDLAFFESFAQGMGGGMISTGEAMASFMYQGDLENHTWNSVKRNYEYVAYAYGFDTTTMQPTTEVCYLNITTPDVERYVLDFNFDIQTRGPMFSATIEPVNYSGYYFFGVFLAKDVPPGTDPELVCSYCEAAWEEEKGTYASFAESQEELLHFLFNDVAYKGKTRFPSKGEVELTANTEYVLWAFGLNEEALLNTEPVLEYFKTGAPTASENTFELTVENLKSRKATVTVTPSNEDSYVALVQPVSRFAGMSDQAILEEVCNKFTLAPISGAMTTDAVGLEPDTEYWLMAFGVNGGVATTALYKEPFRTPVATPSNASLEFRHEAFYDVAQVAALDADWGKFIGYCEVILPVEVVADPEIKEVYCAVLAKEDYEAWSEETLMRMLMNEGQFEDGEVMVLNYEEDCYLFGFGIDQDDDYTEVSLHALNLKQADCSPAQEFLDWVAERQPQATAKGLGVLRPMEKTLSPRL